jgi:hypothetical protein
VITLGKKPSLSPSFANLHIDSCRTFQTNINLLTAMMVLFLLSIYFGTEDSTNTVGLIITYTIDVRTALKYRYYSFNMPLVASVKLYRALSKVKKN